MAIIKWYTQPEKTKENEGLNFSSFYYYDEDAKILVRIRLELRRQSYQSDDGSTLAQKSYSLIGFSDNEYDDNELKKFTSRDNSLYDHKNQLLTNDSTPGYWIYDFNCLNDKLLHPGHKGSIVVAKEHAFLPKNITEENLIALAGKTIKEIARIKLTDSKSSEEDLIHAILCTIKEEEEDEN